MSKMSQCQNEAVYTQPELAAQYKVNKSTILRLYNKYKETKSTKDLPKSGRSHILTNREECRAVRYI
ncbi:18732_t:CDS:2, partial [Funneliformis geosporum]